jgi:hypothetical protein
MHNDTRMQVSPAAGDLEILQELTMASYAR